MNLPQYFQGVKQIERSYESAIAVLNSRRRGARPITQGVLRLPETTSLTWMPSLNSAPSFRGVPNLVGMREWLQQLGHSDADINSLNIIHVTGTKGKGSTCAFVESFLRVHGKRTGFPQRTGLYTSPHLIYPEERIRINFKPLSKDLFAKYFFEVCDGLSQRSSSDPKSTPRYLQLFALLSFHAFIKEKVNVAIYETHEGGEYDATNVVQEPTVTAITPVDEDHINQLGPSVENIAWHKAGIFKAGAPAFSASQQLIVAEVLLTRAAKKGVALKFVDSDSDLPDNAPQLNPEVLRLNCSLARAVSDAFLARKAPIEQCSLTPHDIFLGIQGFSWPGRFQLIKDGNCIWFLDGAHNKLSVKKAAQWFVETGSELQGFSTVTHILIFSQISDHRDSAAVLECLAQSLYQSGISMQHVIFTTYETINNTINDWTSSPLAAQYTEIWGRIYPKSNIWVKPTINNALELARRIGGQDNGMQVLVTGSLHLVGGALSLLEPNL